jgi:hypothetical protein
MMAAAVLDFDKDFFKVKTKISPLAHKWADIGKALGIYPNRIKQLSSLDDVLEDWLKQAHYNTDEHGLPTWETLAKAIRDPNGGNDPALADKIFPKVSTQSRKRPARDVPVPSSKPQSKGTDYGTEMRRGISTPEYKAVQTYYANLTSTLDANKGAKNGFGREMTGKGWIGTAAGMSGSELVDIAWDRIKTDTSDFKVFTDMLAAVIGLQQFATQIKGELAQLVEATHPPRPFQETPVVQPQSPVEDVDFVEAPEPSRPGPSAEKVDLENYRGLALIVTCDYGGELPGANRDGEEMYKTLHDHFGYNVHYLKNEQATRKAILEKLKEIEHYLTRCGKLKPTTTNGRRKAIVFAFAGHGNNKDGCDYIKTYNGGEVMVMEDIVGAFLNPRTKDVLPIPKLFFIDTCRGGQQLAAINRNSESTEVNYRMDYSTIPDHVAPAASRWTPLIAQKLRQHDISLADVMAKVNQQVYEESGRAPRQADTADRLVTGPLFLWHDKTKRQ